MLHEIRLPRLSDTVDEAEVVEWLVESGVTVSEGGPLMVVATDKVDVDVPAPVSGVVIRLIVDVGTTIDTGTVICTIESA